MGISTIRKAVFLDRDGVINPTCGTDEFGHSESPLRLEDFQIFPYVGQAVRDFNRAGYLVFVVTNQPAAAKGKTTFDTLAEMHALLLTEVLDTGGGISRIYTCPHHPDEKQVVNKTLLGDCACRKPKPGLLLQAAREFGVDLRYSWMVGDSWKDIEAGKRAGCRTVLVMSDRNLAEQLVQCEPDFIADNLAEAAAIIRKEERDD